MLNELILILAPLGLCAIGFLHTKVFFSVDNRHRTSNDALSARGDTVDDNFQHERIYDRSHVNLNFARATWRETDILRRATVALTRGLRMNSILDNLLDILSLQIPFETAQVLLLETDNRLFLARESVRSGRAPSHHETIDLSDYPVLRDVLDKPDGLLLMDAFSENAKFPTKFHESTRSWIGVPLLASNSKLGLLCTGHRQPNQFARAHLRALHSLAPAVVVAIQNARIAEKLEIYASEWKR